MNLLMDSVGGAWHSLAWRESLPGKMKLPTKSNRKRRSRFSKKSRHGSEKGVFRDLIKMAKPVTHISVFLASPGDVEKERCIAFGLIAAHTINNVIYKNTRKKGVPRASATGTIGSDMLRKNYVSYLVRQYNQFLKIGRENFGDGRNVSYSFLGARIIKVFKVPANDLPLARFGEVVDFIKKYIDNSILGRNNRSKGWKSCESYDEFCAQLLTPKPRRKRKAS